MINFPYICKKKYSMGKNLLDFLIQNDLFELFQAIPQGKDPDLSMICKLILKWTL